MGTPSSGAGTHQGSRMSRADMAASEIRKSPMVRANGPETAADLRPDGALGQRGVEGGNAACRSCAGHERR